MPPISYAQLLRQNRSFRYLWYGQIVSQLGDWFSSITVQALILTYTRDPTSLAWFMIASMLPGLVLGPIAGVVVDRLPRKSVMIGADLLRMVIALGFLLLHDRGSVWVAYACQAGLASVTAFFEPARISTLPNVVTEEELVSANALSSVTWSILLTSGALVGGIIGRFFGPTVSFLLNSASFLGSALLLAQVLVPPTERGHHQHHLHDLLDGIRYVRRHASVLGALTAKLGWGLAGGMQVLLPLYGQRLFPLPGDRAGQLTISILFAAGGAGTAVGPIVARRWVGRDPTRIRWAITGAFLLGGLFYLMMSLAPNLWLACAALFLARMNGAVVWVFSTILLQVLVRDAFRGRVFAAETSFFTAAMMLSSVAVTQAMDRWHVSIPQAALALGVVSVAVGLCWLALLLPGRLRNTAPVNESA